LNTLLLREAVAVAEVLAAPVAVRVRVGIEPLQVLQWLLEHLSQ